MTPNHIYDLGLVGKRKTDWETTVCYISLFSQLPHIFLFLLHSMTLLPQRCFSFLQACTMETSTHQNCYSARILFVYTASRGLQPRKLETLDHFDVRFAESWSPYREEESVLFLPLSWSISYWIWCRDREEKWAYINFSKYWMCRTFRSINSSVKVFLAYKNPRQF